MKQIIATWLLTKFYKLFFKNQPITVIIVRYELDAYQLHEIDLFIAHIHKVRQELEGYKKELMH